MVFPGYFASLWGWYNTDSGLGLLRADWVLLVLIVAWWCGVCGWFRRCGFGVVLIVVGFGMPGWLVICWYLFRNLVSFGSSICGCWGGWLVLVGWLLVV